MALRGVDVTRFDAGEALLVDGGAIDAFTYGGHETRRTRHSRHGAGVRVTVWGESATGVRKTVELTSFQRLTGMIVMKVTYANGTGARWRSPDGAAGPTNSWRFPAASTPSREPRTRTVATGCGR